MKSGTESHTIMRVNRDVYFDAYNAITHGYNGIRGPFGSNLESPHEHSRGYNQALN
jgi:hypothetical protein